MTVRIPLADDHVLVRGGVRRILDAAPARPRLGHDGEVRIVTGPLRRDTAREVARGG
jgi:hypothetical protein